MNAIAVREHENPRYRGFRTIPGTTPGCPLLESFHTRSFGVGVRRGYESPDPEIDPTNLVDHVLGSPPPTAPVGDRGYGGDYSEHVDSDRPAATHRRVDDDRRSMRLPEFHIMGEDALRIANDTRALPPGRSHRRRMTPPGAR
jgi:hypothetical protein